MDFLSMLGGGVVGKAFDYVDTAIQYYNQKKLNRQAQNDTQQNMKLQKQLNLEQQFDSVKTYTSALRNAGLNPALASSSPVMAQGVSSAAGNAGNAAKPDNSFASTLEAFTAAGKQGAEIENLEANTDLQRAEAKLKEQDIKNKQQDILESQSRIELNNQQQEMLKQLSQKYGTEGLILGTEYSRMLTEDSVAHHALMDYCDRRLNAPDIPESERDFWTAFRALGRKGKLDSGAVMAMRLFSESWNSLEKYEQEVGARAILNQLQKMQLGDNDLLDTMAHLPVYQAALVFGQAAEAMQNAEFRKAYRVDLLPAERNKLDEDIRVQKHNDPAGMLKDGDLLGFGIYSGGQILRFAGNVFTARQFGAGSSLSSPQGKQPNGAPKVKDKPDVSDAKKAINKDGAAESWARIQRIKNSDPEAYKWLVDDWQRKYGKK